MKTRITVPEICQRLEVGARTVYSMLEQGAIPAVRIGKRWFISRCAYENWEQHCGEKTVN